MHFKKIIYLFLDCYFGGYRIGYGLKRFIAELFQNTTFKTNTKKYLEYLDMKGNVVIKNGHCPLDILKMLKIDLKAYCEEEDFSYSEEAH